MVEQQLLRDFVCYFQLMVGGLALVRGLDVVQNARVALGPNPEAATTLLLDTVEEAAQGRLPEVSRAIQTLHAVVSIWIMMK